MSNYKEVPLRRKDGSIKAHALVDAEDYERVMENRWHLRGTIEKPKSVRRNVYLSPGKWQTITLAEEILGIDTTPEIVVDHMNRNPLDNRRQNLRVVTRAHNFQNIPAKMDSPVRGAHLDPWGSWIANCRIGGKSVYLGSFDTAEEAAAVAKEARRIHMAGAID